MPWQANRIRLLAIAVAISASACGGGGGGIASNPGTQPNRTPTAGNDSMRADGAALNSVNVLANDHDPDGDALTVTIEEQALVGTATVNPDRTLAITALPSGFKGITRLKYRVTDPSGAFVVATAAIFVGTDPFRVLFAGDAAGTNAPEVYVTDFVSPPSAVTAATETNLRLRGFVASPNGATIAYRRADTTAPTLTDLSFVKLASPNQQVHIALPSAAALTQDAQGNDQYRVSPDGQWIAAIAAIGGIEKLYIVNVTTATVINTVSPTTAVHVALPRFSNDSQSLYFLASPSAGGSNKLLYVVSLSNPATAAQISAPNSAASADDVLDYSVAPDQSRILVKANRGGRVGLFFIDPRQLQTEVAVSAPLAPGETILESTIGLPPGKGGSALGQRVAYTVQSSVTFSTYVAEIAATPNPRLLATAGARTIGLRPDDAALLYSRSGQVFEQLIDSGVAAQAVGAGGLAWYDSTGNVVLLEQFLPSGGMPSSYPALAVAVRGSFGNTQAVGTPVLAAHYINVTGFDRGVALMGEGAITGPAPTSARLALVNALAPDKLLYLADFQSPLQLTSDAALVVTN